MPNRRDKNKSGISVYVPGEIKDALKTEAQNRNLPMSELVTDIFRDKLSKLGYELGDRKDQ